MRWQEFLAKVQDTANQERQDRWELATLIYKAHRTNNDAFYDTVITTAGLNPDMARKYWQIVEAFQTNPWETWPDLTWTCFVETRLLPPHIRNEILTEAETLMSGRTAYIKEQKALLNPRVRKPRDIFDAVDHFEAKTQDIEERWPAEHRDQLVRKVELWLEDLR